jgi:hypothetical protein
MTLWVINCPPVAGARGSYATDNGHEDRRLARQRRVINDQSAAQQNPGLFDDLVGLRQK